MDEVLVESLLRVVPDFPKPGIMFYDIDPLLNDAKAFDYVISQLHKKLLSTVSSSDQPLDTRDLPGRGVDLIGGPEARGFIFAGALAREFGSGVCLIRKPSKLPADKISQDYGLEYGKNVLEIHTTAVKPGQRVIICDDLLATGGTIEAAIKLVERLGGVVCACAFLIELKGLGGKAKIEGLGVPVVSLFEK